MRIARCLLLALAACSPPAGPVEPPRAKQEAPVLADYGDDWVGLELPGDDICKRHPDGSLIHPIEPGTYTGILRNARCRQQKLLTMAWLSDTLGVDCGHCHAKDPNDPKRHDFAAWTDEKRAANWMMRTFVHGLRAVDGTRVACESCHTAGGRPTMKVLGEPRDPIAASEWMHEVMASRFVEADGDRLRCRTCHEGMAPGADDWQPEVIRALRYEGHGFVRQGLASDPAEIAPPPSGPPDDEAPPGGEVPSGDDVDGAESPDAPAASGVDTPNDDPASGRPPAQDTPARSDERGPQGPQGAAPPPADEG